MKRIQSLTPLVMGLVLASMPPASIGDEVREELPSLAHVTTDEASRATTETASFFLRVYEGDERGDPERKHLDDIRALDLASQVELCADGSTQLRTLSLGSWQFDLDGECAGDRLSSAIDVDW